MGLRAAVVVTGTEVLTGRVTDANGPWLAERLQDNGIDISQIVIVGDRAEDLANVLRPLCADHDLVITSGGLGPTADDLTAAVVADVQQPPLALDSALEQRITAIVAGWARGPLFGFDRAEVIGRTTESGTVSTNGAFGGAGVRAKIAAGPEAAGKTV